MSNHCVTVTAEHRSHCARRIENDRNLISNEVKLLKNSKIKSYEELPLFLNVPILAEALGISESSAYELMKTKDFPTLRIGSRYVVPKEDFIQWVDRHTTGKVTA